MPKFKLTHHARQRWAERTGRTFDDMCRAVKRAKRVGYEIVKTHAVDFSTGCVAFLCKRYGVVFLAYPDAAEPSKMVVATVVPKISWNSD